MTSTIKPKVQKKCAQYASMPLSVGEKNRCVCLCVHKFYLNNICHQGWDLMAPEQGRQIGHPVPVILSHVSFVYYLYKNAQHIKVYDGIKGCRCIAVCPCLHLSLSENKLSC